MTQTVISDGAYFASGVFVCQRAHVVRESGIETEISAKRTICEVAEGVHDRVALAHGIAVALNAQIATQPAQGEPS